MDHNRDKDEVYKKAREDSSAWPPSDEVPPKIVRVDLPAGKLAHFDSGLTGEGPSTPSELWDAGSRKTSLGDADSLFEFSSESTPTASSPPASEPNRLETVAAPLPQRTAPDPPPSRPSASSNLSPFELGQLQRGGTVDAHVYTPLPVGHRSAAASQPPLPAFKRESASETPRAPVVRPAIAPPPRSPGARARRWQGLTRTQWLLAALAVLALGEGVFIGWQMLGPGRSRLPTGAAPVAGDTRTAPAATSTGREAQHSPPAASDSKGTTGQSSSVMVRSNPTGARVWIDGRPRGQTPLTVGLLTPGQHELIVQGATGRVQQQIDLEPGGKATVVATLAGVVSGGIAVQARPELQIMERGKLVGSSRTEKILLNAGRHTLDLVSESLGYESRQVVDVTPGKTIVIAPQLPKGTLSANARPWARVFIDGQQAGETPLGNVPLEIGPHEITFRHPELGEMTRTVTVTLRAPARVSVDFQRQDR